MSYSQHRMTSWYNFPDVTFYHGREPNQTPQPSGFRKGNEIPPCVTQTHKDLPARPTPGILHGIFLWHLKTSINQRFHVAQVVVWTNPPEHLRAILQTSPSSCTKGAWLVQCTGWLLKAIGASWMQYMLYIYTYLHIHIRWSPNV